MATMLECALEIAREAHAGQVDKAGRPYIEHVLRVVDAVEGEDAKVVAALHDVVEDRPVLWTSLMRGGFSVEILEAVDLLTRSEGEPYANYIRQIGFFGGSAHTVKIADLRDHLHPDRVGALTPSHAERYRRALAQLATTPSDSEALDATR